MCPFRGALAASGSNKDQAGSTHGMDTEANLQNGGNPVRTTHHGGVQRTTVYDVAPPLEPVDVRHHPLFGVCNLQEEVPPRDTGKLGANRMDEEPIAKFKEMEEQVDKQPMEELMVKFKAMEKRNDELEERNDELTATVSSQATTLKRKRQKLGTQGEALKRLRQELYDQEEEMADMVAEKDNSTQREAAMCVEKDKSIKIVAANALPNIANAVQTGLKRAADAVQTGLTSAADAGHTGLDAAAGAVQTGLNSAADAAQVGVQALAANAGHIAASMGPSVTLSFAYSIVRRRQWQTSSAASTAPTCAPTRTSRWRARAARRRRRLP